MEWLKVVQAITVFHQLGAFGHKGPFGPAVISLPWLILVQIADGSKSVSSCSLEGKLGFCQNAVCFYTWVMMGQVEGW